VNTRKLIFLAGGVGLVMPAVALTLLGFGISGELMAGDTNLTFVFWPFFHMLTGGWRSTVPGILITVAAITYNCLLYIVLALLVRACIQILRAATR
jgi:hypothetical protein